MRESWAPLRPRRNSCTGVPSVSDRRLRATRSHTPSSITSMPARVATPSITTARCRNRRAERIWKTVSRVAAAHASAEVAMIAIIGSSGPRVPRADLPPSERDVQDRQPEDVRGGRLIGHGYGRAPRHEPKLARSCWFALAAWLLVLVLVLRGCVL